MSTNRYEIDDEIYITDLITDEDIPSLVKYLNNPTLYANTWRIPSPYTTTDGETFLNKIKLSSLDSSRIFAIRLKENNELIGACDMNRSNASERKLEIGYWLGEPYWNRGIISKVVHKMIDIIKIEWKNFVRIEARIFPWNKASMRVIEKCGFVFEGILRKYLYKNGKDYDIHMYALIIE